MDRLARLGNHERHERVGAAAPDLDVSAAALHGPQLPRHRTDEPAVLGQLGDEALGQFLGHDGEPDADPYVRLLQVADFVAGMTDSYAVDMYRKLKGFALPT